MVKISVTLVILLVLCVGANGWAAQKPRVSLEPKETQRPAEPEVVYNDPLGRSTPQGTVLGFMKSAAQEDYLQAILYLNTKITGTQDKNLSSGCGPFWSVVSPVTWPC